jgi:hypothetical protein
MGKGWLALENVCAESLNKEASQTRDYCVANNATQRAARPDPSLRQKTLVQDDKQTEPLPEIAKL